MGTILEQFFEEVKNSKKTKTTSPKRITNKYGVRKRGWKVIEAVNTLQDKHELTTNSEFGSAYFYGEIEIIPKPKLGEPHEIENPKYSDPVPRLSLLKAANIENLKGDDEISIGMVSVKKETSLTEAITLMLKPAPVNFHEDCLYKVTVALNLSLIKETRTSYSNKEKSTRLVCAVSKQHIQGQYKKFWFAFHPHQEGFLSEFQNSYVVFGCGSPENTLLIPFKDFKPFVQNCGATIREDRSYWHIEIHYRDLKFQIGQPGLGRGAMVDITNYKL